MVSSRPRGWPDYGTVWRWHFYAGLLCIPFILWLAVTGSIYLWRPQIEALIDRPYAHVADGGRRATASAVARAAERAVPGAILHRYQLPDSAGQAVQVIVGQGARETRVYVNPATLAILKIVDEDGRLMPTISRLHGELLLGDRGSYLVELAASNAGRVRSRGGELEVEATPLTGLNLQAGAAFTDATYRNAVPNLLLPAGSRVLDVPRFTWNARGDYALPLSDRLGANLFVAARHVGRSDSGFGEGEVLPRPAYTLVDATVGIRTRDGLAFDLFVTNLFDVVPVFGQEFTTSPGNTTATSYFAYLVGPPRTVGVRVSKLF